MGNKAQVKLSSTQDPPVNYLVGIFKLFPEGVKRPSAEFGDGSGNYTEIITELQIAEQIVLQAGQTPSVAIVSIPMAAFGALSFDEVPYSVAFRTDGPAGEILRNSRASIFMRTSTGQRCPLLNGTVLDVTHGIEKDDLLITVADDRWLLTRITVFGQCQFDPDTGKETFVANAPCIFNEMGYPNCIDAETTDRNGKKTSLGPRFAATVRQGWRSHSTNEPYYGDAKLRTRSWTAADAVEYFRSRHFGKTKRATSSQYYGTQILGKGLEWPAGLGQILTSENTRVLHHTVCEKLTLDAALTKVAHRAGPYELDCVPGAGNADNGNDVANPMDIGGNTFPSLFIGLQQDFDNNIATLNAAFSSGTGVFQAVLDYTTTVMKTAMDLYVSQVGGKFADSIDHRAAKIISDYQAVITDFNRNNPTATAAEFSTFITPYHAEFLSQWGSLLKDSPGRYTLPNGAVVGGGSGTASNGTGQGAGTIAGKSTGGRTLDSLQDLAFQRSENDTSTLTFCDLRAPKQGSHLILPKMYGFTLKEAMSDSMSVNKGWVKESIWNYFHDVCIIGDAPVYESVFSMLSTDTLGGGYLEKAWSKEDQTSFKAYVTANGNTRKAFLEACQNWPLVFCAYRVTAKYMALFAGTKYSGRTVQWRFPKIRPQLISGYDSSNRGETSRNWIHRQIVIESRPSGTWVASAMYDNLQVSLDGTYFTISAQRDVGPHITWQVSSGTNDYDGSLMEPIDIRATLAIELDWRLAGLSSGAPDDDPNQTKGSVAGGLDDGSGNAYTFTTLADPLDYVEWLRYHSRPVGQIVPAAYSVDPFPDKATDGDELFSDVSANGGLTKGRLKAHADSRLRDVRRIESTAEFTLPNFSAAFRPGLGIPGIGDGRFKVTNFKGCVTRVVLMQGTQAMQVSMTEIAPGDITRGIQGVN